MSLRKFCLVFLPFVAICCKRYNDTTTTLLSNSAKGIFGRVVLFDENGDSVQACSSIQVEFECVDTTSGDSLGSRFIYHDSTFVVHTDGFGRYELLDAPFGKYFIRYFLPGYGENRIYNHIHYASKGDTLSDIILAKKPNATISVSKVELSSDKKVLYITKKVDLTGTQAKEYGVVSHFFFSKNPYVCDTSYFHEWVSGATFGRGGYSQEVVVQKSVDELFNSEGGDEVYVVAYIDNLQYYSYQISAKKYAFPNITSQSQVVSFKLDTLE